MTDDLILSREQARNTFRAINGIRELLKALRAQPESRGLMYAIVSNLAVIQMNLAGLPRVSSN
jgi:hypothetical protein